MLYFRSCPRCDTGVVEYNEDPYGNYLKCLNCGFMRDLPAGADPVAELAELHRVKAGHDAREEAGVVA